MSKNRKKRMAARFFAMLLTVMLVTQDLPGSIGVIALASSASTEIATEDPVEMGNIQQNHNLEETPSLEEPTTEEPSTEALITEEPSAEEPTTEALSPEEPTTEAPSPEEPTTEAPSPEEPTTEVPSTEAPVTEEPTTEAPVTEAPTTEARQPLMFAPAPAGFEQSIAPGQYGNYVFTINNTKNAFLNPEYAKYYNAGSPLGIAGSFHLVAFNKANLQTHTNGNILAYELVAQSNFGTNGYRDELTYAQNYTRLNSTSGSSTSHVLVVGSNNTVGRSDRLTVNGVTMDKPYNIIQDSNTAVTPFIDLNEVEADIIARSRVWASVSDVGIEASTSDRNNMSLTLMDPQHAGYYNMTAAQLNAIGGNGYTLKMMGFESAYPSGSIIVNVDCTGVDVINMPNSIVYIDGVAQGTGEVTTFEGGKVIWNFINAEGKTIEAQRMTGMVIAPGATVDINQNLNGTVVAENINVYAESHRTDFTGSSTPTRAEFSASKLVDGRIPTEGEVFTFTMTEISRPAGARVHPGFTVRNNGEVVNFGNISYSAAGEYVYEIREKVDTPEGYSRDNTLYLAVVTVTASSSGSNVKYNKTVRYYKNDRSHEISADAVVFNNTTKVVETSVKFSGTKTLSGISYTDKDFAFELFETGADYVVAAGASPLQTIYMQLPIDGSRGYEFTGITYTEAGTHYYVIREKALDAAEGFTVDSTVYQIKVDVTNNAGVLAAAVTGAAANAINFTNTYQAVGEYQLTASKHLTGRVLEKDQFAFHMHQTDADGNEILDGYIGHATNNAAGEIVFPKITYTQPGTYYYVVDEHGTSGNGYTLDGSEYKVTVVVMDNGDGTMAITETVTKDGNPTASIVFENTYTAVGTVQFEAGKRLVGAALHNGQFTFILKDSSGKVLDTATNIGASVLFDAIQYTQADAGKTYTYTIEEQAGSEAGYVYDTHTFTVTVTVADNGDGTLAITKTFINDVTGDVISRPVFNNSYAASGSIVLSVDKMLTGRELQADQFVFYLEEVTDESGSVLKENGVTRYATNIISGNVRFGDIQYNQEELGTHYYRIREYDAGSAGYIYDPETYVVTVEVADDGDGTLTASVVKKTKVSDGSAVDHIIFRNAYEAEGSISLLGYKALNGASIKNDQFTFVLKDADGNTLQTKTNTGHYIYFDALEYDQDDKGKTFVYTVSEVAGNAPGYTYDATVYNVRITVTDNNDGTLSVVPAYENAKTKATVNGIYFNNRYEAEGEIVLLAYKELSGRLLEDGVFGFELTEYNIDGSVPADGVKLTARNSVNGVATFDAIKYDEPGVYYYQIKEINEQKPGYTYDDSIYMIQVTVTDGGNGILNAVVTARQKNQETIAVDSKLMFSNTYHAEGELVLEALKTVTGKEMETFTFHLTGSGQNQTKTNDASGKVVFDAISYTEKDLGKTFRYTVTEIPGDDSGYKYDATMFVANVTLTDNGDGTITPNVVWYSSATGGGLVESVVFNNIYEAEGQIVLVAEKQVTGRVLHANEFSFTLVEVDGVGGNAVSGGHTDTAKNDAAGDAVFAPIYYDEQDEKTHYYEIREIADSTNTAYTYDGSVFTVAVDVVDDGNGVMKASVAAVYKDGVQLKNENYIRFHNTYTASGELTLQALKRLNGEQTLKEGQFTFRLWDIANSATVDAVNAADGSVSFNLSYTQADIGKTYVYRLWERMGDAAGYVYDETVYEITVEIKDDVADGKLEITESYEAVVNDGEIQNGTMIFTNDYVLEGKLNLSAEKILKAGTLKADEFSFKLTEMINNNGTLQAGTYTETVTNAADGSVNFSELTFDATGTYYYQISEVKGSKAYYTYDDSVYLVTVTATDTAGNGELDISYTIEKTASGTTETVDEIEFVNTYAAAGNLTLDVYKSLKGEAPLADHEFTFAIYEGNTEIAKASNVGHYARFDKVIYYDQDDIGKTFTYTVSEIADPGKTYYGYDDVVYTVEVTIVDNGNGTLDTVTERVYTPSKTGYPLWQLAFYNTYTAYGEFELTAEKSLTGGTLEDGQFQFQIREVNASGNPVSPAYIETAANIGTTIKFPVLKYTASGTYYYEITEVNDGKSGYAYDSSVYVVTVEVTDDTKGNLTADVTAVTKDGEEWSGAVSFSNTYAASGSYRITADKTVVNANSEGTLGERAITVNQFRFHVQETDASGAVLSNGFYGQARNAADGSITFPLITYTEPGTHYYKVTEDNLGAAGYGYDNTVYMVTVVVTDNGDGTLKTEGQIAKVEAAGNTSAAAISFVNTYQATGSAVFNASKRLVGTTLTTQQFEFELREGTTVLQTVKNNGTRIRFIPVEYDMEDAGKTFTYTISEKETALDGYTSDTHVFVAEVTVTDAGNGTLSTHVSYTLQETGDTVTEPSFTNIYTANGAIALEAEKVLLGRTIEDDQFIFNLVEVTDATGQTVVQDGAQGHSHNDSAGEIVFAPIKYEIADAGKIFYYKITEVIDEDIKNAGYKADGYTYDASEFIVSVQVTDQGSGDLKAEIVDVTKNGQDVADNKVLFNNTYEAKGSAILTAEKKLHGIELTDQVFEFVLADVLADGTEVVRETVTNTGSSIMFTEIAYTQADIGKTFTYHVYEKAGNLEGYSYDSTVYTVTVTVTDNGDGTLRVTRQYSNTRMKIAVEGMVFNNVYTTEGQISLEVVKNLTGTTLVQNQFEFTLTEVDKDGNIVTDGTSLTKKNDLNGKTVFGPISYAKAGTYYYQIKETNAGAAGYSYDDSVYTVEVTATDNGAGDLHTEITGITKLTDGVVETLKKTAVICFSNAYTAQGSIVLEAQKVVTGTDADDEFTFELIGSDGTYETVTRNGEGSVSFTEITYTQIDAGKTYTYVVSEMPGDNAGYVYDNTDYTATVYVQDNGNGTLTPQITWTSSATHGTVAGAVFNNVYHAEGGIVLKAEKNLTGRVLKADEFTFKLEEVKDVNGTPLDAGTVGVILTAKNDASGTAVFDAIPYTTSDAEGVHYYKITEEAVNRTGYTSDTAVYIVVVKVTDGGQGAMNAEVAAVYRNGERVTVAQNIVFHNTYKASGSVDFGVTKTVSGEGVTLKDKQFTFILGNNAGKALQTVMNDVNGDVDFEPITYNQNDIGKTFIYYILEQAGSEPGYTYDDTIYRFTVTVSDSTTDGVLDIAVVRDEMARTQVIDQKGANAQFENIYTAKGDVELAAAKILKDGTLKADEFSFTVTEMVMDGTQLVEGTYTETVTNAADGSVVFSKINLEKSGTYYYQITESVAEEDKKDYYVYDNAVYLVTVEATDDDKADGKLEIRISDIEKNGISIGTADQSIVFNNEYKAVGELGLHAVKILNGDAKLKSNEFTFELKNAAGEVLQEKNNVAGLVVFDDIVYDQTQLGEYTYTICEVADANKPYYTYDPVVYTVHVVVTDNGDGTLDVHTTYTPDGGLEGVTHPKYAVAFYNNYNAKGSFELRVFKELEGRILKDGEFEFTAVEIDKNGAVAAGGYNETVANIGNEAEFPEISYTKTGTHYYRITETAGQRDGYTYDDHVFEVTVVVTDKDQKGELTAELTEIVKMTADGKVLSRRFDDVTFKNSYEAEGVFKPEAVKTLEGEAVLTDDQFTFILEDSDGNEIQRVQNQGTAVVFDEITYDQDDIGKTFEYTMYEEQGTAAGYMYDDTVYTIIVKVEDCETDGELSVTAEYQVIPTEDGDDGIRTGIEFVNAYTLTGEVQITATKELENKALTADEFSFTLTEMVEDQDQNLVKGTYTETVKNDADGNITFSEITYDKSGTYWYQIEETVDESERKSYYEYDSTIYLVTVTAEDKDGEGQLDVSYTVQKQATDEETGSITYTSANTAAFKNIYVAEGSILLSADKGLVGRNLEDEQFTFLAEEIDEDGNAVVGGYRESVKNESGKVNFPTITYTHKGTYYYQITEVDDAQPGYGYDDSVYVVTVTVTDENGDGTLSPSITEITKDGIVLEEDEMNVSFENTYTAHGSMKLYALKSMSNSDEIPEAFAVVLKEDGNEIETVYNDMESGVIAFTELAYDQDDAGEEFTYTVSEAVLTNARAKQYIYDKTVYNVVVSVEDNGDGTLNVTAMVDGDNYTNSRMHFINAVSTVEFSKVDALTGNALEGAKLQVLAADGTVVREWVSSADVYAVTGLDTGETYTLHEADAPAGYAYAEDISFVINEDGTVTVKTEDIETENGVILMEDTRFEFNVNKTDYHTGEELNGSRIQIIEKETGTLVDEWISVIGEKHDFAEVLEIGVPYILRELEGPEGYDVIPDVEFTINRDGSVEIEETDRLTPTVDENGDVVYMVRDKLLQVEETTEEETTEEETTEEETTEEETTEEETTEEETTVEQPTTAPTTEEPTTEAPTTPTETTSEVILGIEDYSMVLGWISIIMGALMMLLMGAWAVNRYGRR